MYLLHAKIITWQFRLAYYFYTKFTV
jgi:WD40 repeat protein